MLFPLVYSIAGSACGFIKTIGLHNIKESSSYAYYSY